MSALLALAEASEGRRANETVELSSVVRAALPTSARIDALLEPTTVRGDATLLRRAAANLVDNALRYGDPQGIVNVRLRDGELTIANTGPVIAGEDLARLTQPFERLERGSSHGTGLGLSIVKEIAESHGGRLVLAAPPSGGLVARLSIAPV